MSSTAPPPKLAQKQTNQPNQTLYVTNINDKIPKPDLRRALYGLFATYGPVLDVIALKTMKMRGQAHVVFRDVQTSSQAMRALQGFNLFGRELRISYGKGKSNIISTLDGTAKVPEVKVDTSISSELQKSIFNAPPPSKTAPPTAAVPKTTNGSKEEVPITQGVKRRRDDGSDEEAASMDEEDEGEAMEESDSE